MILPVSPNLVRRCEEGAVPAARVRLTPNGIDTSRFHPATRSERSALRRELGWPDDTPVVLFVGFFSRDKRPDLLFRAWRVVLDVNDLVPALGQPAAVPPPWSSSAGDRPGSSDGAPPAAGTNAAALRLSRARTVASSLDLRGARVEEALDALGRYLDDASLAGLGSVLIIHGLGTGALRDAVRSEAGGHPLVKSVRAGERGEGGDGATIVSL